MRHDKQWRLFIMSNYYKALKKAKSNKRINQHRGVMSDIDLDREIAISKYIDMMYDAFLQKEKIGEKPIVPAKRVANQNLPEAEVARLSLDAEDYSDLERKIMEDHRDLAMNRAKDYAQGIDQDIMLSVMEEALKPKHKFFMSDVLGDSDLFKKKAVAEAVASGDINNIINVYPLVQDNEMAKAAIEEIVARSKDPNKAFALEKSLKTDPNELDIPGIDLDVRIREALNKMGGRKELIDEASVGGFSDNVTPELANMGIADDQMFGNELFDMKLRDRTSQNRAYESSFDKFLTQEGVDVSDTNRYKKAIMDELIELSKEQRSRDLADRKYTMRRLHSDPVMRDHLDERGTLPVAEIKKFKDKEYSGGSEKLLEDLRDDLHERHAENPGKSYEELVYDAAMEWVPQRKGFDSVKAPKDVHPGNPRGNAKVTVSMKPSYLEVLEKERDKLMSELAAARSNGNNDAVNALQKRLDDVNDKIIKLRDKERMTIEAAENSNTEMIMDQFENPTVLEWRDPTQMNESMAWHNELVFHDEQAAKEGRTYKKKQTKDERRKQVEDAIASLGNKGFGRNVDLYIGSNKVKPKKVSEKKILEEMKPSETTELSETPDVIEYLTPETRTLFAEVNRREKNAAKKARAMAYPRSKNWSSKDYASFAKGKTPKMSELDKISAEEEVFRELSKNSALSREFKDKHRDTRKITISNKIPVEEGKNVSKWDKPANRSFIVNTAKQKGFRLSEQIIERLLNATKQQVIDYIDNISNPMPSQRKRK